MAGGEVWGGAVTTTIQAIPTLFRGIRFRSRLEAKWAAFFAACSWEWTYEPFDLNGYIPDFGLSLAPDAKPLIVEVKPAMTLAELHRHTAKIDSSGWDGEALLVGATVWDDGIAAGAMGLIRERQDFLGAAPDGEPFAPSFWWQECELFHCLLCDRCSVLPAHGSWHCRACGGGDGKHHIDRWTVQAPHIFAYATNEVQWKPGRRP